MAARYTNITLSQMDTMLKSKNGWTRFLKPGTKEHVYRQPIKGLDGAEILIYSSIRLSTSAGRQRGRDAIRVAVVRNGKGYIKSRRVHRTQGWRDNMWKRIKSATREAYNRAKREG